MRKVKVFQMVRKVEDARSYWEKIPDGEAVFHQFGTSFESSEFGYGNFSTAIIERKDGTVENVDVTLIQFDNTALPPGVPNI